MMGFQPRLIESCFTPTCPSTFPPLTGLTAYQASPLSKNYSAPAPYGNSNCLIVRRRFSLGDGFRSRQRKMSSILCLSALSPELKTSLDKVVASQKVILFMKGTKEFPQCGFSHTVVQILMSLNVPFETVNILENDLLRQALKEYSSWPTFPQLYIDGEFFGGCDITVEAYKSGQLQELLEKALCS